MRKVFYVLAVFVILLVAVLIGNQFLVVRKAHSTFENYYAFRGCTKLLKKTDSYGLCTVQSGKVIKLVKVNNKWYLDGDLPVCYFGKCF